ncbi:YIP1 family protein [Paenibacillus lutimineralis]|uniref:YIP1 family protein n=1 Tax=Paenibacillus lutimineralis TaxID=2707005 RepID=A0A3Q9I7W4_9BACL|nr:YIP1 family protein [Paenibacillus lutimineralis]AZS13318.1 YIP1 family protein [Paenibacillus lutimineralis]
MGNLFTIFVSPEITFQRLKSSKLAWLTCMIVLIVLSCLVVYLQMPIIEQTVLDSLKSNPQISSDAYDSVLAGSRITSYVMAVLSIVMLLFVGGLLFMLLNLIVRGEAKYMQLVTVAAFSALPGMINGILTGILLKIANAQTLTDVSISLGAFIQDKGSLLYKMLSVINPFSIWTLILYIIGASVMMNRPKKQVAVWIVITWLIFSFGSLLLV